MNVSKIPLRKKDIMWGGSNTVQATVDTAAAMAADMEALVEALVAVLEVKKTSVQVEMASEVEKDGMTTTLDPISRPSIGAEKT